MTPETVNRIKREAILELLTEARQANINHNSTVIRLNDDTKLTNFSSVPVPFITNYLNKLG